LPKRLTAAAQDLRHWYPYAQISVVRYRYDRDTTGALAEFAGIRMLAGERTSPFSGPRLALIPERVPVDMA